MNKLGVDKTQRKQTQTFAKRACAKSCARHSSQAASMGATSINDVAACHSDDRYERQAQDVAWRWARATQKTNHHNSKAPGKPAVNPLSGAILSVPAAHYHAPGSAGEALPWSVRQRFEQDFNADFSVVRIHRDRVAANKARKENAKAFTAGAHIYFAEGHYRPGSVDGQQLIAHELTHVLQQTGRAAYAGRQRATDIQGRGDIQRDAFFDEFIRGYRTEAALETATPVEPTTRDQRQRALEAAIGIITEIVGTSQVLNAAAGEHSTALMLEQVMLGADTPEAQAMRARLDLTPMIARSFIYDALKLLARHEGAAKMVDEEPALRSYVREGTSVATHLASYFTFLREHNDYGLPWFYELIDDLPDIQWPYALMQNLWNYLVRPERGAHTTPQYDSAYATMLRQNNQVLGFGINERQRGAYLMLREIDQAVEGYQREVDAAISSSQSATYRKQDAARRFIQIGTNLEQESFAFRRRLGRNIRTTAEAALSYWQQVEQMFHLTLQRGGAQLPEAPDIPILQRFLNDVTTHSNALLYSAEPDTVIPTLTEYQTNVQAFTRMLRGYQASDTNRPQRDTLAHYLEWNLFRFEHRSNEAAVARAAWLGWAMRWSEGILVKLGEYDAQRDSDFSDTYHRSDVRLNHRLEMSRYIWNFSLVTRDSDLERISAAVETGADVSHSYITLTGRWVEDTSADIDQMNEDFANTALRQMGFSTAQLVSMFKLLHLRAFNDALSRSLMSREGTLNGGQRSLVNDAVTAADSAVPMPTRWTHSQFEIVWHTPEGEETADTPIQDLLRSHPVFTRFRDNHAATGGSVIIPWGYSNNVVAWKLPSLDGVISYLRSIDTLNALVIELAGLAADVSDQNWYKALINLVEEGMGTEAGQTPEQIARRRRLLAEIRGGINEDIDTENARRRRFLTRATSHRRRVLVGQLNPDIQAYIDGGIRDYVLPNQVLRRIENFIFYVQPRDTDVQAQEAALTLGLAEKLENMFIRDWWFIDIRERRYDLVTGFYGAVERAIDMANNHPDDIRRVLFIPENLTRQERLQHGRQGSVYENANTLLGNVSHLERVMRSLNRVISEQQERYGFESVSGTSVKSLEFAHEFTVNPPMGIDVGAHIYLITAIGRPFRFHPAYGVGTDAQSDALVRNRDGSDIEAGAHILTYSVGTNEPVVVNNDAEGIRHLERLNDVLALASFLESLAALEASIEEAGELGLDILELVPGIGQGVMIARALYAVTVFIAEDLPQIKQQLFNNPQEIINLIVDFIGSELPRFVEILLFGEIPFEARLMADSGEQEPRRRSRRRGAARRLQQLFNFVTAMVEDAMRGFVRLRGRVRSAFVGAQGRIAASALLLRLVEALPTLIAMGSAAVDMAEALGIDELADADQQTRMSMLQTRLQEEIQAILNGFAEIELPEDIIPLDIAVEVLLSFALSRLPGRKGRVIAQILELTGATGQASQLIASALEAGGANPNIIWRRQIRSRVEPLLRNAQTQMFNAVADLVNDVSGGSIRLSNPTLETPRITPDETVVDIPETEGKMQHGGQTSDEEESLQLPTMRGGVALTRSQRRRYTREFGHNFDHVRIHSNPDAREFTRSAGARALTSGSHIFLNDSVNTDSADGQFILRHELSHVLQQTGPRPATRRYSNTPSLGRARAGLQINPLREAAADRMAHLAAARQDTGPLAVESAGGDGWLPSMDPVAIMLLDNLTEEDVAETQADTFEQAIPRRITRKTTFISAVQDARQIWNRIKDKLRVSGSDVHYTQPFNGSDTKEAIKGYLRGSFSSRLSDKINGIVFRSVRTLNNGRMRLRPQLFVNNLETYIFARTGLVMSIDMNGERVDDIHIRYLHLGNLRGGTTLWNAMRDNTMAHIPAGRRALFNDRGWGRVREIIANRTHEQPVWHDSQFRLSDVFITEVVGILANLGRVRLGEWDEYRDPELVSSNNAGLRVATHGQLTTGTMPRAATTGRQSHHIPQFLLVQYFRNNNTTELFRNNDERLPGFYPLSSRDELEKFSTTGAGGTDINFLAYDPNGNRGDGLPAISLAAITHQRGRLHMNAASSWGVDEDRIPPPTQGRRIDNQFMAHLTSQAGIPNSKQEIADLVAPMADTSPELTQVRQKVYTAIKRTYSSMYAVMMAALPHALRRFEVPYYTEAAMVKEDVEKPEDLTAPYRAQESQIDDAVQAIREKNTRLMGPWR